MGGAEVFEAARFGEVVTHVDGEAFFDVTGEGVAGRDGDNGTARGLSGASQGVKRREEANRVSGLPEWGGRACE